MSKQGVPYMPHSETSREAAELIEPRVAGDRRRVLEYIREQCYWMGLPLGSPMGATDEEQQDALGMNPSTQRPRRGELVAMKLVRDSGRTRRTRSGRRATVWVAV